MDWATIQLVATTVVTVLGVIATQITTHADCTKTDMEKYYQYWQNAEKRNIELQAENDRLREKLKRSNNNGKYT